MQEKKKFLLFIIGLFITTGVFWLIWMVRAYAWVEYREQQVNVLGTVLIGLATVMLVLAYAVFRIARPSYMLVQRKKMMVIAILSILAVMVINFIMLHEFRDFGYTISTIAAVEDKESEGGKYYFQIIDSGDDSVVWFACDEETYEALQMNEDIGYSIQYRKLTFGKEKAVLGYVDVINTINKEDEEPE